MSARSGKFETGWDEEGPPPDTHDSRHYVSRHPRLDPTMDRNRGCGQAEVTGCCGCGAGKVPPPSVAWAPGPPLRACALLSAARTKEPMGPGPAESPSSVGPRGRSRLSVSPRLRASPQSAHQGPLSGCREPLSSCDPCSHLLRRAPRPAQRPPHWNAVRLWGDGDLLLQFGVHAGGLPGARVHGQRALERLGRPLPW